MMTSEKEVSSSDTLERSNLSSLHSDHNSAKKQPEFNNKNSNLSENKNCFCQHYPFNMKLIPYPMWNPNFYPNQGPQCFCQQAPLSEYDQSDSGSMPNEWQHFNWKWPRHSYTNKKDKSYEVKTKNKKCPEKPSAYCEVFEGIPRRKTKNYEFKNIESPINDVDFRDKNDYAEKIEIYYFDHGNSAYYHTTDVAPILLTEKIAEKSSSAATRFWAELFGYVHIGASFLTAFILQFLRCILFSLVRPLTVGVVQLVADYFIKPVLSITFNGIIQPILILFYNVATSFRDCCEPLAAALGFFIKEIALLFRSCRLIEITHNYTTNPNT